jgi:hypothetical protein
MNYFISVHGEAAPLCTPRTAFDNAGLPIRTALTMYMESTTALEAPTSSSKDFLLNQQSDFALPGRMEMESISATNNFETAPSEPQSRRGSFDVQVSLTAWKNAPVGPSRSNPSSPCWCSTVKASCLALWENTGLERHEPSILNMCCYCRLDVLHPLHGHRPPLHTAATPWTTQHWRPALLPRYRVPWCPHTEQIYWMACLPEYVREGR